MISIITAVYNQRAMNELFWEKLKLFTHYPFELIIIDNKSNDGSGDYFKSVGATVIRNDANYSYPYCQNKGIALAKYDWLAFLNNDVIVSTDWDKYLIKSMKNNSLDVATSCGIERVESTLVTRKLKRRWHRIKNFLGLFGYGKSNLIRMHKWMYGDWPLFCQDRQNRFSEIIKEGFVGNSVMMHRRALNKIGLWDERLQDADFDLYLRTKHRSDQVGDIKPMHICLDVFNHHYIRLTEKCIYPPFADRENFVTMEEKWPASEIAKIKNLNN